MWLYKVFLIKKREKKQNKKRDNTLGRFPPLQICFMFLPALLNPRPPCPRFQFLLKKTLHPPQTRPPTIPVFFLKTLKKGKKKKKPTRETTKKEFLFFVSAGLMIDASSVGMLNCIVKYKNRLIFYYEVEKKTKKKKTS